MHEKSYALIALFRRDGTIAGHAKVDDSRAEWANQWRWSLASDGYAVRNNRRGDRRSMHRELMGCLKGDRIWVDHINRDRCDNRIVNLRLGDALMNNQNRSTIPHSSRYQGVSWWQSKQRWIASIKVDGTRYYIGAYRDEGNAGAAVAAFRRANVPNSQESALRLD